MLKDAENLKRAHLILKRMEELYAVVQTVNKTFLCDVINE